MLNSQLKETEKEKLLQAIEDSARREGIFGIDSSKDTKRLKMSALARGVPEVEVLTHEIAGLRANPHCSEDEREWALAPLLEQLQEIQEHTEELLV